MTRKRRTAIALVSAGLLAGLGQPAWAAPAGAVTAKAGTGTAKASTADSAKAVTARTVSVTLVTGDRVTMTLDGTHATAISPAKGREHTAFSSYRVGSELYVVPEDAARLVRSGRVDRRLFDVTGLVRSGYDDAARDTVPLIVGYRPGTARPLALTAHGARVTRNLPAIGGAAVLAPKTTAAAVWPSLVTGAGTLRAQVAAGIDHIWLDGRRRVLDDVSDQQIGAPVAWQAGYTGAGVTVAVLDGGIDTTHPDLAGKVVAERNFSADPNPADTVGHGTHVASIIAGTGAASGGRYRGVAPDATLLDGKVCQSRFCDDSAILAGMQWAAAGEHAKVVNLSVGGADMPGLDPLEQAVNDLTAQYGTLFVIAAGNDGADGTIESPGSADAALTVGAVDSKDQLADFSSRGPRVGDSAVKPDITAPGVDIVAARAAGTEAGEPVGDSYVKLSGTSMATPHVAGAAALLAQEHPDWTAAQFKAALMASAQPNPDLSVDEQGAGRVDVGLAIGQTLTSDPASVSLGVQQWPHTDDQPITKTVTYHNAGTTAVTLNLALNAVGPGGAAPAGMFTLSADQLTVPAGGQAQVTLTADTRVSGPDGRYSGELVATAGGARVGTPVAVTKEVESYDLTITLIDRNGSPGEADTLLQGTDEGTHSIVEYPYDPSGTTTLRLPKGQYDLSAEIDTPTDDPWNPLRSLLTRPALDLTGDTHITLDARTAKPVMATVPDTMVAPVLAYIGYDHVTPYGVVSPRLWLPSFDGVSTGQQGPSLPAAQLRGLFMLQWAATDPDGFVTGGPFYSAAEFPAGGLGTGFTRHYTARDLAEVHATYGPVQPGDTGTVFTFALSPLSGVAISAGIPVTLPGSLTLYYTTVDNARWNTELTSTMTGPDGFLIPDADFTGSAVYQAGRRYQESWADPVFGPAFPVSPAREGYVNRQGDTLHFFPPLYGDGSGHAGDTMHGSGVTTVYRNGTQIAQVPDIAGTFDVPADTARYRIEAQATRSGFGGLSSTVRAAWTFSSGHVDGTDATPLPVMAVRLRPALDANNAAPPGRFTIPVSVQRQSGSSAGEVTQVHVAVSYDDGKTWQPATLCRSGDGWAATVTHPAGGGFVSLRADATDSSGDMVEETIIHAYALKA